MVKRVLFSPRVHGRAGTIWSSIGFGALGWHRCVSAGSSQQKRIVFPTGRAHRFADHPPRNEARTTADDASPWTTNLTAARLSI